MTTELAPIFEFLPTEIGPKTFAPAPIITLSLTVGDNFTHVPGDANFDGQVDVLDIVELVDHIINVEDYYDWNLMFIMSDLNGDYLLNIQDVIMMVGLILNNN